MMRPFKSSRSPANANASKLAGKPASNTASRKAGGEEATSPPLRRKLPSLRVIVFAGKGGAGKSSSIVNLAVAFRAAGYRVGILDLDGQHSIVSWRALRPSGDIAVGKVTDARAVAFIKHQRDAQELDYLFVDMGKDPTPYSADIVRACDLVVVPTRPSFLDMDANREWIKWLQELSVPFLVVINSAPPRRQIRTLDKRGNATSRIIESPLVRDARAALSAPNCTVWSGQITQRHAIILAVSSGQGCRTYEPGGSSAREYSSLAAYLSDWFRSKQRLVS